MLNDWLIELLIKLLFTGVLVVINSIIIHFITQKLNFDDLSFDNPTSIAIIISLFHLINSYLPKFNILFFLISSTIIPIVFIKEFYNVSWKKTFLTWLLWIIIVNILVIIFSTIIYFIL